MSAMSARMQKELFARSLLLQSCWSFERMQGLGFAYCLEPWIERCWSGQNGAHREAQLRHQEYFNTQPYMASLVVGMVCALEEDASSSSAEERPAKVARLMTLKTAAASALAGLGDALFWGTLRPFCAALALAGALVLWPRSPWAAAWAAGAYLLAYNGPAVTLRWRFLRLGYEWKDQIAVRFQEWPGRRLIKGLRVGGLALALAASVLMLRTVPERQRMLGALALAAAVGLQMTRVSAYRLYTAAGLTGLAASLAGWL